MFSKVNLIIAGVGLITLILLGLLVAHWKSEADKVPGLEKQVTSLEQARAKDAARVIALNNSRVAVELQRDAAIRLLDKTRQEKPKTLVKIKEVPIRDGQTTCPSPTLHLVFIELWNDAAAAYNSMP